MAKKGQIFHYYSFETKKKAVAMRLEGMTKKEVASALQISDIGRLKVWMRKYREHGEEGLIDRRRRSTESAGIEMNDEDTPEEA
ncbi:MULTISPECIES: helix-turn-helix domain-containing protein [Paenibacillus]|uniref:Helix-turn-helix domain-containing protein n=1 Tax=Paenibacillus campinasensis TaxID=66347 RepID=A0A268ERJ6_9BACL|nr:MULTISPECIES: helix-turn-helix domain-containing protein [Paenibacillus]MUG66241.1 helix-turn-helix domain-containing protein [Paenibacillus campinasensis]PAD75746.1 helix-turn-helix domain-containing protein [Paenibacillus campinasensis]PAK54553.1 helix-turn-helix domain-containing protein [Paenibacillus sp. 7541]